jgi:hypothetical protein
MTNDTSDTGQPVAVFIPGDVLPSRVPEAEARMGVILALDGTLCLAAGTFALLMRPTAEDWDRLAVNALHMAELVRNGTTEHIGRHMAEDARREAAMDAAMARGPSGHA